MWVKVRRAGPGGFSWGNIKNLQPGQYLLIEDSHPKLAQLIRLGMFVEVDDDLPPDAVIRGDVQAILEETQPKVVKPLPQVSKVGKSERK
jgi:hypothetical protein